VPIVAGAVALGGASFICSQEPVSVRSRQANSHTVALSEARSTLDAVAHDPDLVERIRAVLARERGVSEKRMFGGVAFLINGNLAVAASGRGGILLRVDPAQSATLSAEPSAARAVMRGREMDGWLRISTDELADLELDRWINRGAAFARSLSPK
jgi:hypothetical protein